MRRAVILFAAVVLSVTACATRRNSASVARPECAGPWLATVNNNGSDDAEVYAWRGQRRLLGILPRGATREYLTTVPDVYATSASGGSASTGGIPQGVRGNKNITIKVTCADKA